MATTTTSRRLVVAWRDPDERAISPVGMLTEREDGAGQRHYEFSYLRSAETLEGFLPFASFPDLHRRYQADRLFPMFENRTMPRERPSYDEYLRRLDLPRDSDPFVVLAASGGRKATDRVEVFPVPRLDPEGRLTCRFFARGIEYIDGAEEAVARLRRGDVLRLEDEPDNEYNARAILMHAESGSRIGYVPDLLVEHVHDVRDRCGDSDVHVHVEHVNDQDTPVHMRLLCELISCAPEGYEPFSGQRYELLSELPAGT